MLEDRVKHIIENGVSELDIYYSSTSAYNGNDGGLVGGRAFGLHEMGWV